MNSNTLLGIRARTDAKLRYANILLGVLRDQGGNSGTDFDQAFQESFLFYLLGAKDAFLQELNVYYSGGLPMNEVRAGDLKRVLGQRQIASAELAELYRLETNGKSWFFHAKEIRDHSAHVGGVPRAYHAGGPNHGKVFLRNPTTGEHAEIHVLDALGMWLENMKELLERLRTTAIAHNV
ncbi:MAG: hypothetical protein JWN23_2915 [Rhodocyclales bacterium]|nr:hypothetical protein [Rhodocyclales bacterium]